MTARHGGEAGILGGQFIRAKPASAGDSIRLQRPCAPFRYFLPAASTEFVGSAPSHVWSDVGPYVDSTGLFSRRK